MAKLKDLCFEVIQTCPNKCLFCSSWADINQKNIIAYETFTKVIDHFDSIGGIEEISISGGEPFLHPQLYDMIRYCKLKGIRTVLFTSGIKRSKKMSDLEMSFLRQKLEERYSNRLDYPEDIAQKIIEKKMSIYCQYNNKDFSAISKEELLSLKYIGLDKIVFDFQSGEKETCDYLMGRNHFEEVSLSIIRACQSGLNTDIHFIPMKSNYKKFPDLIKLLNIAGVNSLSILNFVPQGRGLSNKEILLLSDVEMQEFISIFKDYKDYYNGHIRIGIPLLNEDKHKCTAGLSKLVIKYDGTVLPCPAFKEYDIATLNQLGIKTPNIYDDLSSVSITPGTRVYPLCKKLYNFNHSIK